MEVIFQEPVTIMLLVGAVWKSIDLMFAPHDRILRFLVACLVLLFAGQVLSLPEVDHRIDAATALGVGKVVFNGVYMAGLYALILFFVLSVRPANSESRRRQVLIHTGLLAGAVSALALLMIATPAALRGHTLSTPHMAQPAIASFYAIGNAYFIYAYATSGIWSHRYARIAARSLALGLEVMTLGFFGLAVTSVDRVIWVVLRIGRPESYQEFNTVNWSISDFSLGVMLIGMSYAGGVHMVAQIRSFVRHRRMYDELTALWAALVAAYPELVLDRGRAGFIGGRLRSRRIHERSYRRIIECRDGLVRLSPYLQRVAPDVDLSCSPASELARYITEALASKPIAEGPETALSATFVALPSGDDWREDADALIAISQAFAKGSREQVTDYR